VSSFMITNRYRFFNRCRVPLGSISFAMAGLSNTAKYLKFPLAAFCSLFPE